MLHIAGEHVKMKKAVADGHQPKTPLGAIDLFGGGGIVGAYRPFERRSESGVFGDPTVADPDHGKQWVDLAADKLAEVVRAMEADDL